MDNHNNAEIGSFGSEVLPASPGQINLAHARKKAVTIHVSLTSLDRYESAVEDAIATCNGDLRGALKALIIANEFLERDIERLARKCVAN